MKRARFSPVGTSLPSANSGTSRLMFRWSNRSRTSSASAPSSFATSTSIPVRASISPRTVAEQESLGALLLHEMIFDILRTLGAMDRVDHQVVTHVGDTKHVSEHMLGDAALVIRADAAFEYDRSLFRADSDVVGIEAVVCA